jgi:pimeloyl-ACP methyl ester carboxylesterase
MKKISSLVLFLAMYLGTFAQGEIVSYYKINTLNFAQLDSILNIFGAQGLIAPNYELDVYKVLYRTPYRTANNLVTVSGAMVVPKNTECPVPMSMYMHGTVSDKEGVPSYGSSEMNIGLLFGMLGNIVVLPDYLGLGDSDTSVIIHPYIHAWSQANTSINMIRAGRHLEDSLGITDNGQLFLFGYSQGGFATAATLREIETNYASEFNVTASAPMSGAFDLKGAQKDLIISDSVYATPGYLPYIILSYQSIYGNLYDSIQQVLKSPYDSTMPALFYSKNYGIGYINGQATPVPKNMVQDSTLANFIADSLHPLRVALAESDLLDWAPQSPVKLFYCDQDEQVTYLNSENAYTSWTANGAPSVEKQNLGPYTHGGCVEYALINGLAYFNSFRAPCVGITEANNLELSVYPNPTRGLVVLQTKAKDGGSVTIQNLLGQQVYAGTLEHGVAQTLDLSYLTPGTYIVRMQQGGQVSSKKLIIQ